MCCPIYKGLGLESKLQLEVEVKRWWNPKVSWKVNWTWIWSSWIFLAITRATHLRFETLSTAWKDLSVIYRDFFNFVEKTHQNSPKFALEKKLRPKTFQKWCFPQLVWIVSLDWLGVFGWNFTGILLTT